MSCGVGLHESARRSARWATPPGSGSAVAGVDVARLRGVRHDGAEAEAEQAAEQRDHETPHTHAAQPYPAQVTIRSPPGVTRPVAFAYGCHTRQGGGMTTAYFDKHREQLDAAVAASASREYYSAFDESPSPRVYGESAAAEGKAAFEAWLGTTFPLDTPGSDGDGRGDRAVAVRLRPRRLLPPRHRRRRAARRPPRRA